MVCVQSVWHAGLEGGLGYVLLSPGNHALIKKKVKFSSFIRKFRVGQLRTQSAKKGVLIYEEMRKYFPIYCMRRTLVIYDFGTEFPYM
jgi:hypothetical protein